MRPQTNREWYYWDRIETLRSKALRGLGSELDMLENSVVAFRNGKPHVTIDHIERAIFNLEKLRQEFKDDD